MTCVDGNCVDVPPEDVSGSGGEDVEVSSVVPQPDSAGSSVLIVGTACPEGQIFQYGMCHIPVPDSHYNSSESTEAGGCHANHGNAKPISRWWILLWGGILMLYIVARAKGG